MKVLSQGCGVLPILKNIEEQVTTFLTEFAVGKEALTIQPPTDYTLRINQMGEMEVFASSFTEYGEQLQGYLDFSEMPQTISQGLQKAFMRLATLDPGQGMVIFSPTEFYQQYDSSSDVINPLIVTHMIKDEQDKVVEMGVRGWFLFPNKKLSQQERELWLKCHQLEEVNREDIDPKNLVMNPHVLPTSKEALDSNLAIKEYISWINRNFIDQTGEPLFTKDVNQEDEVKMGLRQKVQHHIHKLYDQVINFKEMSFYKTLWQWIKEGQKSWAEHNEIDFDWYWNQLEFGLIQIASFHPSSSDSDPFSSNSWDKTEEAGVSGYCKYHGNYEGHSCPKCKRIDKNK